MIVADAVELYRYGILHHTESYQRWLATRCKQFSVWCDEQNLMLEDIQTKDIRRYIDYLRNRKSQTSEKQLSSHTVHGHARAVRSFLNWCSQEDGLEELVSEKVTLRIGMPHLEEKIIEVFTDEHIKALFVACDKEYMPKLRYRDRAILSVLLDTGIRADELCSLTLDNISLKPEAGFIRVHGKGDKWREVGLGKAARTSLHRYIHMWRKCDKETRYVFLSRFNKPLGTNGLGQLISRLGDWAHVEGVRCSPHTFRHTYATRFLLAGGDVMILSILMGHTSVTVTQRYLKSIKAHEARTASKSVLNGLLKRK